MGQEDPLGDAAGFARFRGSGLLSHCAFTLRISKKPVACSAALCAPRLANAVAREPAPARVRDGDRPNPGEVEPAKEGAGAQLAGPAQVHEQLDKQGPELPELPRKLVDGGQFGGIKLLRKQMDAPVGKRMEEVIKGPGNSRGFLLTIHAG